MDSSELIKKYLLIVLHAANSGNAQAQCILGNYYLNISTSESLENARVYLQSAADQGFVGAYFLLAVCLERLKGERWSEYIFHYYKLAADQGNPAAQINIGECYAEGKGVEASWQEAIKYFELAAAQNNPLALSRLGECYEQGLGVEVSQKHANEYFCKSFQLYKARAATGDPSAQWHLGMCYENGKGVPRSHQEAFRYYKLAADQNHLPAMEIVGSWLSEGIGTEKSNVNAQHYLKAVFQGYKSKADRGDAFAQEHVGLCFEKGLGVKASNEEAFKYFTMASDQGSMLSTYFVGKYYEKGKGVARDAVKAISYYRIAADNGVAIAQNAVGDVYRHGHGVKQSIQEAIYYYKLAANQGSSIGLYNLGECLFELDKYSSEAFHCFQKAADLGFGLAQYETAICYLLGNGVECSQEQALHYFNLAAEANISEARFFLQYHFLPPLEAIYPIKYSQASEHSKAYYAFGKSLLLENDPKEAVLWFKRASMYRLIEAWMALAQCYYEGLGVEKSEFKAYQFWRRASQRSFHALYNLGVCFEYGIGTVKDEQEMLRCYFVAAQNGINEAQNRLELWFEADGQRVATDALTIDEKQRSLALPLGLATILGSRNFEIPRELLDSDDKISPKGLFNYNIKQKTLQITKAGMEKLIAASKKAAEKHLRWYPGDFSFCGSDPQCIEDIESFIAAIPLINCKQLILACPLSDEALQSLAKITLVTKGLKISLKHPSTRARFLQILQNEKKSKKFQHEEAA